MDANASVVVLSYARPRNIPIIVAGLFDLPFVVEVVVWHQGPESLKLEPHPKLDVVHAPTNYFTYGRFLAIRQCKADTILTVDDDYAPRNWTALYKAHRRQPEVVTAGLKRGHFNANPNCRWGTCHEVLLGFGSTFQRRLVEPTLARYTAEYGHDEVLHRKADRLFTILLNRHHQILAMDAEELPGHSDDRIALWKRKDHGRLTLEARRRAWRILGI